MLRDGFLRFCNDPEIACCKAERELEQLRAENASLRAQLSASQRREKAAVEDFTSAAHNGNILCEFCGADCIDAGNDTGGDTCQCGCFEWRGPQDRERRGEIND